MSLKYMQGDSWWHCLLQQNHWGKTVHWPYKWHGPHIEENTNRQHKEHRTASGLSRQHYAPWGDGGRITHTLAGQRVEGHIINWNKGWWVNGAEYFFTAFYCLLMFCSRVGKKERDRTAEKGEREGKKYKGKRKKWMKQQRVEGAARIIKKWENTWRNRSLTDVIFKGRVPGIFMFQVINFCCSCINGNKHVWLCLKIQM